MEFDPQLSILKSCIVAIRDAEIKDDLKRSRHRLYLALDAKDRKNAKRWADALKAGLLGAQIGAHTGAERELVAAAEKALAEIMAGLKP